jgi:hypothetical protein
MKPLKWFLIVGLGLLPKPQHAKSIGTIEFPLGERVLLGTEVRTGGDTVFCEPVMDSELGGYYAFEYLLHRGSDLALIPVASVDASLDRMIQILEQKIPPLALSLRDFKKSLFSQDPAKKRVWWPVHKLAELGIHLTNHSSLALLGASEFDPGDLLHYPSAKNCYAGSVNEASLQSFQTIIRREDIINGKITYLYNEPILKRMADLQLSILLIHEWLWDFYSAVDINNLWMMSYLFHTDILENTSASDLWKMLHDYHIPASVLGAQPGSLHTTKLALGNSFSCILHNGKVDCWGKFGEHPTHVPNLVAPEDLVAGAGFVCALDQGQVVCWGVESEALQNMREKLGDLAMPIHIFADEFVVCAVDMVYGRPVCAPSENPNPRYETAVRDLQGTSDLIAFGISKSSLCIKGASLFTCYEEPDTSAPVIVLAADRVLSFSNAENGFCFIDHQLSLHCSRKEYELDIDRPLQFVASSSRKNFCAMNSKEVICHMASMITNGTNAPPLSLRPKQIAAGSEHFCLVDEIGVKCWGYNGYGQTDVPVTARMLN